MKIGVIGAGNIGQPIIRKLAAVGYEVKMANSRGPETLKDLSTETGATAVDLSNVVQDVDVVFLAVPTANVPNLPKGLFQKAKPGTIVVDVTNYYPYRDGHIKELDDGILESEWVSNHINHPVVKAFNTIIFLSFIQNGKPAGAKDRIALPISGDDLQEKKTVAKILDAVGFDSVDAGSIAESWRQQPGSAVYITDLSKDELASWLKRCDRKTLQHQRDEIVKKYFAWPKDTSLDVMLSELRVLLLQPAKK